MPQCQRSRIQSRVTDCENMNLLIYKYILVQKYHVCKIIGILNFKSWISFVFINIYKVFIYNKVYYIIKFKIINYLYIIIYSISILIFYEHHVCI